MKGRLGGFERLGSRAPPRPRRCQEHQRKLVRRKTASASEAHVRMRLGMDNRRGQPARPGRNDPYPDARRGEDMGRRRSAALQEDRTINISRVGFRLAFRTISLGVGRKRRARSLPLVYAPKRLCQMWCTSHGAPQQGPLRQTRRQRGDGKWRLLPYKQGERNANRSATEPRDGGRKERP